MVEQSFKEKVRLKLMYCAVLYYDLLVRKDYLIFSRDFKYQKYYIVSAFEDNFLHLTGVHTNLKAKKFFEKCYQKTLEDGDFEINDKSQKGSIRRKMSVLENAI
ncbi:PBECR4 domain-containing protein [Granulicatella elegans]|uniref:PBECR4 domain-containing protein n=1 Tax=Granulicatella elegans TaxID=137732 RepID=UPI0028D3550D|nr:PBECR4 domain-containing protein [Granulicatella elegans]